MVILANLTVAWRRLNGPVGGWCGKCLRARILMKGKFDNFVDYAHFSRVAQ
ncbi:hypothetical protein ABIF68_001639 [Bradyrhizobium japonicum]